MTGIAGYLGLVIGVGLLELVAFGLRSTGAQAAVFHEPRSRLPAGDHGASLLLVGVGVLAGLMPALRAAQITPTEAMRAE